MKKVVVFGIVMMMMGMGFAQEQKNEGDTLPPYGLQNQVFIYNVAKKYNDMMMQKNALYNILSFNPSNIGILDSIALMYFEFKEYASAALVSQDIVLMNPNDMLATEIAALSFENLGVKDRALPYYETLYLNSNDIGTLYQIAFLQFDLRRYNEATNNANTIINAAAAIDRPLVFSKGNNMTQQVSLKAAALRLKAMIEQEKGNIDQARDLFAKCLEIVPDFALVLEQVKNLK